MSEVVRGRLRDLLPAVAESLTRRARAPSTPSGVDQGELAEFGLDALNRRLAIIGVSLQDQAS